MPDSKPVLLDELPPLPRRSTSTVDPVLARFADMLRAHPGKWGEYPGGKASVNIARYVRQGKGAFAPGGFEASKRGSVLYVRFTG